jgi:hypothetical protein
VQHVDLNASTRPRDVGRQPQSNRIDIATHRFDRRKDTELVKHGLGSNITGVEDLVDAP